MVQAKKEKMRVYVAFSNSWDSGACLVSEEGKVLFAANEERFNREKLTSEFPKQTLALIEDIIRKERYEKAGVVRGGIINYFNKSKELNEIYYQKNSWFTKLEYFTWLFEAIRLIALFFWKMIPSFRYKKIDHHLCHAAGAYYTSGLGKALIITMDAYGDGCASTVSIGEGRDIKVIRRFGWESTPAHLYARITQYLGFKSHRHEGKITGLAAYGKAKCYDEMKKLVWIKKNSKIKSKSFLRAGFNEKKLKALFSKYKSEDVAASLQKVTEEITCKFVGYWVKKTGVLDVVLAGGLFANVKLNQRIHELPGVRSVYVFPHMGDGGLAVGAALAHTKPRPKAQKNLFLGPGYTDAQIESALKREGLKFRKTKNIEKEIAKRLSEGKTVARYDGRMEYGPRALGNRSILYQTTDKKVNDWLNKKLKRTEFMPFAPATLWEKKDTCYKNLAGGENSAKNMTITFDCRDEMKKKSPGVVHLDNTARPQLVRRDENKGFYDIIAEYHKITGNPSIINTSFNIHEEPIVNTPQDAIKAYKQSKLDHLAIGKYMV